MKKALILSMIISTIGMLLCVIGYMYFSRPVVAVVKEEEEQLPVVDTGYYFNNVSTKGDTITLSVVNYQGLVGDFGNEQIIQKWICTDPKVKKAISQATVDFHQQPGELKMLATAKGLTNDKYLVNEKFTEYIIVENNKITKFNKGKD